MNMVMTIIFASCVATTTAMNLAFTLAPETMTRLLMEAIHATA